jgi:hypothetical protein
VLFKQKPKLLHVYGQKDFGDRVYILANRDALLALKDVIEDSLEKNASMETVEAKFHAADGQQFEVGILQDDSLWETFFWRNIKLPYEEGYQGGISPEKAYEGRITIKPKQTLKEVMQQQLTRCCFRMQGIWLRAWGGV